ncbi:MAG: hypothetical protein M1824_005891 [Vezdaea acicularis]|nr:MAG: hypothetical protein M1824_005891 [Vezdaea acicularis]
MAEVVSLTASIIQISNATLKAVKYLQDVKDAAEARKRIRTELVDLYKVLLDLRDAVEEAKSSEPWFQGIRSLAEEGRPLHQLKVAIEELTSNLKPTSSMKSLGKALIWTLDKKKTNEILLKIERAKSSIEITLQRGQFALSLATDQKIVDMNNNVMDIVGGVSILQQTQRQKSISELHKSIISWLSPLNFPQTQNDILRTRQKGTGEWLLKSKSFIGWLHGAPRILWCPGMPGAGKTVLASTAIDYLQTTFAETDNAVAFIYCNYNDQTEQSSVNLVSSLLKQLAQQMPSLLDGLEPMFDKHLKKITRPTLQEMSKALQSAVLSFPRAFIVVDAVDECLEDSRRDLLDSLGVLADTVGLMITSRPSIHIEDTFPNREKLEITAKDEDVYKYLEARISQTSRLAKIVKAEPTVREKVTDAVIKNVRGMFLLARLHMDMIANKQTRNAVVQATEHLPNGLDNTYEEALQRIDHQNVEDRKLATRILYWITYAKTPLSMIELQHALAIMPEASKLDGGDIVDGEILLSICAGLVSIEQESGLVRLVHYTTQDFFKRIREDRFPDARMEIAQHCLTYLLFDAFAKGFCSTDDDLEVRLRENPLLRYAAQYWSEHTRGDMEHALQKLILRFLKDRSRVSCYIQVTHSPIYRNHGYSQQFPKEVSGLHVAASSGLRTVTQLLLDDGADVEAKNERGETALHWAAWDGHEAVVQLLVEKGADLDVKDEDGRTALHRAASRGHEAVEQLLVEKGADVEVKDKDGRTALHQAAWNRHEAVVQLLVEKGADVDVKDKYGQTALHQAALNGHEAVVQLLVEKGADLDVKEKYGQTALHWAAWNRHEAVVQLLVEKGADVDVKDKYGETALHQAALNRHEAVEQLLVEKGADVDVKDEYGRTALHWAAWRGQEAVVQLLVEKGADVKDGGGRTALHWAASRGHEAVVQLLVEKGADLNVKDEDGRTALHRAASRGHEAVVQLLVEKGADIDVKDKYGQTALYRAASNGHEAVVQLLVEKRADT